MNEKQSIAAAAGKAVMVMVFALSAALCLKVFLWSERISKENAARDGAVLCAQTAAELVKHEKGVRLNTF